MLKLLTHNSTVPPCLWAIANTSLCSLGAAHEFRSIYIIQYISYQVDLQFLENKVCERPNHVWCIESNCLLSVPRCSGEKCGWFQMHGKIWKTGWHSCCVRNQFWDVRTPEQWMILNLSMGMASGDAVLFPADPYSSSVAIPVPFWALTSPSSCSWCCWAEDEGSVPSAVPLPPPARPARGNCQLQGRGWGWGWRWMWGDGGFQSLWFGWVLGGCPSPWLSRSVPLDVSLVSKVAALQGRLGNAANTTLS